MKTTLQILILSFLATFVPADEITGLNLRTTAGSQAVNPTAVAGAVLSLDANKRPTFGGPLTFSAAGVATFAPTALSGSQATSALDISQTWNTSGTPTALKLNVTDTASNASSLLLDLQVGGVSKLKATKAGDVQIPVSVNYEPGTSTTNGLRFGTVGRIFYYNGSYEFEHPNGPTVPVVLGYNVTSTLGVHLASEAIIGFSNGSHGYNTTDAIISRDSAATLQLGTDAAGATTQTIKSADRITSDGVGSDLVIQGGNGRGAAGGSLIFKTSPAAGAGVTGTPTTALTIDSAGTLTLQNAGVLSSWSGSPIFSVNSTDAVNGKGVLVLPSSVYLLNTNIYFGSAPGAFYGKVDSAGLSLGSSFDAIMSRDSAAIMQLGVDHATTPTAQTFKAHDVTTGTGASMTIAGGKGSVAGGDARIGTSVTNGAPNPRILVAAAEKTLTESTATIVVNVTVAAGKYIGGELIVTTHADDATDFQAITEHLTFSAVNKGGTVTATIQAAPSTSTTAASAGTLTTAWTAVANGNSVDIKNDAASSLTQTTLKCSYQLRLNTDDTVTVTP